MYSPTPEILAKYGFQLIPYQYVRYESRNTDDQRTWVLIQYHEGMEWSLQERHTCFFGYFPSEHFFEELLVAVNFPTPPVSLEMRRKMQDLYDVGTRKAVGYLPLSTITDYYGGKIQDVKDWAKRWGYEIQEFKESECMIGSGAPFVYDYGMLAKILEEHRALLRTPALPLPRDPDDFVTRIATRSYSPDYEGAIKCSPEVYRLIGLVFDDARFR